MKDHNKHNGFSPEMPHPQSTYDILEEAVFSLWGVVNALSTIKSPCKDRFRVTIFGSARIDPGTPLYLDVRKLAMELTRMGCDIVTGGGPGLMEAANEGSVLADPFDETRSIGINVRLPMEQQINPFVEDGFSHQTFFSRLHHFVLVSDAFVVVTGGIGTALEALMIWQLLQVRSLHQVPLIMVGPMWAELMAWARKNMIHQDPPLASDEDMGIPQLVMTMTGAIEILRRSHQDWLSHRCDLVMDSH